MDFLTIRGDDPGPAGRLLQAWRRLAERDALDKAIRLVLRPKDWMVDLTNALDLPLDAALEDVVSASHAPNLSQIARFTCNGLMQGTIKTFLVYILPVRVPVGRSEAQGRSWRTKNGGRTGRDRLAGPCWMAGWKSDLARAVIIRSTICPLRNVKGRNESVRSVVVVQAERKIRLGHPHTPNLNRQRGGERWKDMQERSLAMASLDAVV
jgi:hypothetical protein